MFLQPNSKFRGKAVKIIEKLKSKKPFSHKKEKLYKMEAINSLSAQIKKIKLDLADFKQVSKILHHKIRED